MKQTGNIFKPQSAQRTQRKKGCVFCILCVLCALCGSMLSGCRAITETERTQHDYRYTGTTLAVRVATDSVYILQRDSIYIRERGDTVFVDRWHTRTAYRDRLRTDTLHITDTVRVEVIRDVERVLQPSWWDKFWARLGRCWTACIVLALIYLGIKLWKQQ